MHGKTLKVTVPSGKVWEIRETNGDDDATLSTMGTATTGENVYIFLSNIIIGPGDERASVEDVKGWPINDKYYLLFKQRLFNQGAEFKFKATDPDDSMKREVEYTEDLALIDGDLGDPKYKPTQNQIFLYPHKDSKTVEFTTSSKRKLRYKILTGKMELGSLASAQANQNRNTPLLIREMEEWQSNQWLPLLSFRQISSKEMVEIRGHVAKNDRQFNPTVSFTNPFTNTPFNIPLFAMPTFYFPEETT